MESGPLHQNIGHTLELLFKLYIFTHFEPTKNYKHMKLLAGVSSKLLKNQKSLEKQIIEQRLNTHDLRYLLILCLAFGPRSFFNKIDCTIKNWEYRTEKHEIFHEPAVRPNISDFKRGIYNLNTRYSSSFDTRYPIKGYKHLPNSELLIVGASTFYDELKAYELRT